MAENIVEDPAGISTFAISDGAISGAAVFAPIGVPPLIPPGDVIDRSLFADYGLRWSQMHREKLVLGKRRWR